MASLPSKLTVAEFESRYGQEKPYYEFWRGEPVQKAMPTWIHGFLQGILLNLLTQAGYKSASEVKLKIDPQLQLIPDVIATRGKVEFPYPTSAVEIVVEVLSEDDPMSRILARCRSYHAWGFQGIYVVDPESRAMFQWKGARFDGIESFAGISVNRVWDELDRVLQ